MDLTLLVMLCFMSLASVVFTVLALMELQQLSDRQSRQFMLVIDELHHLHQRLEYLYPEADLAKVGQTWMTSPQEQGRVEALLAKQSRTRSFARTGSDPFFDNSTLAP